MSNTELEEELSKIESDFNEYKNLLNDVYENMSELSDKYNKINEILTSRNGK